VAVNLFEYFQARKIKAFLKILFKGRARNRHPFRHKKLEPKCMLKEAVSSY